MKSTSEVRKMPRSVKKFIRREKARLRKSFDGDELSKAIEQLMQRFNRTE